MVLAARMAPALTNGPVQPEYMGFSSVETDKIVDLSTGGFTYTIPLGDVKTPSGVGYPIVLNYEAGIQAEQEATWCGLGWSLNAGAINRKVIGYPDDYAGENYTKYAHDNGDKWTDYFFTVGYTNYGSSSTTFGWRQSDETGSTFLGVTGCSCTWFGFTVEWHPPSRSGDSWSYDFSMNAIPLGLDNSPTYHHEDGMEPESYWSETYGGMGPVSVTLDSRGGVSLSAGGGGYGGSFGIGHQELSKKGVQSESKSYSIGGSMSLGENAGTLGLNFSWAKWRWKFDQMTAGRSWDYLYQSPRTPVVSPVITKNPLLAMVMGETGPWHFATPGGPGEDLSGKGGGISTYDTRRTSSSTLPAIA